MSTLEKKLAEGIGGMATIGRPRGEVDGASQAVGGAEPPQDFCSGLLISE